jgi:hypothetical protein
LKAKHIYEYKEKTLKNYERNMQELCNSIKNPNYESWALKKEKMYKPKA